MRSTAKKEDVASLRRLCTWHHCLLTIFLSVFAALRYPIGLRLSPVIFGGCCSVTVSCLSTLPPLRDAERALLAL